jgi:prepilin-type N-terminal cleavage/methylation domain-containing protein
MNNVLQDSKGFSILEVMIAITIMAFITVGIYQVTAQTYKLRDSLGADADFYTELRIALLVLEKDISSLYTPLGYQDEMEFNPTTQKPLYKSVPLDPLNSDIQELLTTSKFWSQAISTTGIRPSRFIGTQGQISFITTSHVRIYRDSLESDFAKVTYELIPDPDSENNSLSLLVKTEDTAAFAPDRFKNPKMTQTTLLRGVKTCTFTFNQREGDKWKPIKSWDSQKEEFGFFPPDMIEIQLEIIGPKQQSFEGKIKIRPELPFYGISAQIF